MGEQMRIDEFLEKHSVSGGIILSEEVVALLVEYVRKFNFIEILDFSAQFASLHEMTKEALNSEESGVPTITSLLAFVRMVETIKDSREMLREVFKAPEFDPPQDSFTKPSL